MSSSALAAGLRHLRGKLAAQGHNEDSEASLLHAFLSRRDDSAFAVLVRRHGPMVMGVCRRVLGHEQDAEDAFQATFLVLAQSAARLRKKTALASWLYGIAYRIALKAKRSAARRHKHEGQAPARPSVNPAEELSWREVQAVLDEEVARLPDIYRSVFVLCCLESVSVAETARRLGLKQGTVASRLAEARKRLQRGLARRGVESTALLAVTALATPPASALSAGLISTTTKAALATALGEGTVGLVSAPVAELVKSAASAAVVSKTKMVVGVLLVMGVLAGAGVWVTAHPQAAKQATETPNPPAASRPQPPQAKNAEAPQSKESAVLLVKGRVLDPDGKPVKNARLYWPRVPKTPLLSEENIEIPQCAKTGAKGRFRFELPRSDIDPDWKFALVAAADGYGVDGVELPKDDSSAEVTLRLVKDQPIEGRIVSTEGKPLVGVRVRVLEISTTKQGRLDDFLTAWQQGWRLAYQQMLRPMFLPLENNSSHAVTDKDGRFRISGAGCERLATLQLSGPGVAHVSLHIINRAGFDAASVNKTALDHARVELGNSRPPLFYGPTFTYVAPAGRRIEGTVREAGSGKGVAGIAIFCHFSYGGGVSTVSDKDGRYKLEGVLKRNKYLLGAEPPAQSAWLATEARPDDEEGLRPLHVDFTVARGIIVRGRLLERATGKGVRGEIRFVPLPGNKYAGKPEYDSYKYYRAVRTVDADGRFQIPVIPGPGVLTVHVRSEEKANGGQELNPYKQAEFDAKDRERVKPTERGEDLYFTAIDRSIEFLNGLNAVKYLDLAPDAGTSKCDLFVERGATRTMRIEDPEGKPLAGTMVAGVTARWPTVFPIKDATCTIFALDPKKPRLLVFFHTERNLAGSLTLRGDEKRPLTVRLAPVGTVTGRLLDREGQPIVGAFVDLDTPEGPYGTARALYAQLQMRRPPIRTDKKGRFRLEGIVPDVKFMLNIYQGRTFLIGEPRIGVRQVKSGETLDLGDRRVKPGP